MPTVDLNTQDLLTFDLGLDSVTSNQASATSIKTDLSHLDFGSPFESSITDWNSLDFGLPDLI